MVLFAPEVLRTGANSALEDAQSKVPAVTASLPPVLRWNEHLIGFKGDRHIAAGLWRHRNNGVHSEVRRQHPVDQGTLAGAHDEP